MQLRCHFQSAKTLRTWRRPTGSATLSFALGAEVSPRSEAEECVTTTVCRAEKCKSKLNWWARERNTSCIFSLKNIKKTNKARKIRPQQKQTLGKVVACGGWKKLLSVLHPFADGGGATGCSGGGGFFYDALSPTGLINYWDLSHTNSKIPILSFRCNVGRCMNRTPPFNSSTFWIWELGPGNSLAR